MSKVISIVRELFVILALCLVVNSVWSSSREVKLCEFLVVVNINCVSLPLIWIEV